MIKFNEVFKFIIIHDFNYFHMIQSSIKIELSYIL